jgi:subtilase family serine protease
LARAAWAILLATALAPAVPVVASQAAGASGSGGLFAVPAVRALPTGLESPSEPPTPAVCEEYYGVTCYQPAQVQAAYGIGPLSTIGVTGADETIAIIEPLGSPSIATDLSTFDQAFGLPNPPSFLVIAPAGAPPDYTGTPAEQGWAEETALDVEWAHVMAPHANIVLVETPIAHTEGLAGFPEILSAENWVIDHGFADVISQSFETTEETLPSASLASELSATYLNAYYHHVTVVSASGDNGVAGYANADGTSFFPYQVVQWPASDPYVTAVGGTTLDLDGAGVRVVPDVAWNDTYNATVLQDFAGTVPPQPFASGGGVSSVFSRPSYQDRVDSVTGSHRGVPDISMSAGCTGPVDIYSAAVGGWFITCGTSEAAPLFAGVVALADQMAGRDLGLVNPALYRLGQEHYAGIVPIDQGENTVSFPLTETASTLTGNAGTLTGEASTISGEASTISGEASTISGEASTLTGDATTLTADAGTLTGNAGTVTLQGYRANGGYSLVTGLGTVDASALVPEPAAGCATDWSPLWQWSPPWQSQWGSGELFCGPRKAPPGQLGQGREWRHGGQGDQPGGSGQPGQGQGPPGGTTKGHHSTGGKSQGHKHSREGPAGSGAGKVKHHHRH